MIIYPRQEYIVPETVSDSFVPGILCDSIVGGDLEDLTEEDWTI